MRYPRGLQEVRIHDPSRIGDLYLEVWSAPNTHIEHLLITIMHYMITMITSNHSPFP